MVGECAMTYDAGSRHRESRHVFVSDRDPNFSGVVATCGSADSHDTGDRRSLQPTLSIARAMNVVQ